ncbi:unnamed protein product [Polarella glacialis]|uniref:Uncharacterized protein n=1 Tax=Polarella glacialis TaxID=89957 RepID=A0A813H9S7_POLGL|nr:unnamed protein product [Polarella glacialis]
MENFICGWLAKEAGPAGRRWKRPPVGVTSAKGTLLFVSCGCSDMVGPQTKQLRRRTLPLQNGGNCPAEAPTHRLRRSDLASITAQKGRILTGLHHTSGKHSRQCRAV